MEENKDDQKLGQEDNGQRKRLGFVSFKGFVVVFCLCMFVLTATGSYMDGVITQIEKQFGLSSVDIGFFSSSNFYTTMFFTLLLGLLSKDWNHPRVIAIGGFLYSLACFLMILPHIIYGTGDFYAREFKNGSDVSVCYPDRPDEDCGNVDSKGGNVGPLFILIVAGLCRGIGNAPFYPLGLSYAYVNADTPKQGAFAVGVISTLRSLGGVIGNGLSAICTTVPVNLQQTDYKPGDPQWLGAWWLGLLVQGISFILVCTPLLFFPKTFKPRPQQIKEKPKVSKDDVSENGDERKNCFTRFFELDGVRVFVGTIKTVPALLSMIVIWIFLFRSSGYGKFFVKIIQVNYRQPVFVANIISGVNSGVGACGSFFMGVITAKLNDTRKIANFFAFTTTAVVVLLTTQVFLGCGPLPMEGYQQENSLNLTLPCNSHCNCKADTFTPVCGADGKNFFSPCHAGCSFSNLTECACQPNVTLTNGWCESNCQTFIPYVITFMLYSVAFGLSPGRILQLRLLKDEYKAFGMAFNSFMVNLVAFMPAPIIYGSLVDSTCLVWRDLGCGRKGSCWLYDNEQFWFRLHVLSAAVLSVTLILVGIIIYMTRNVRNPGTEIEKHGVENGAYIDDTCPHPENEMHMQVDVKNSAYNKTYDKVNIIDSRGFVEPEIKQRKVPDSEIWTVEGREVNSLNLESYPKFNNCTI